MQTRQQSNNSRQFSMTDSKKALLENKSMLNQSVVSPVQVDASMTKSSRKRFAFNNNFSRSSLDLGQFNTSKLSNLYESFYQPSQKGEIICLAQIDKKKDNQLSITNEALQIFRKYQKNPITFVGNFGKKQSGKSFWYDKILNLSQVEGAQYSRIESNPGLYMWSVPFVKNNLRIFLVDFSNSKSGQSLSGQDEKLLDLQLILAEAMVLIPEPEDKKLKIADAAYTNFNSSMGRLTDKGSKASKQTAYWPRSLYSLYRSIKCVSPQTDKLSYLFADYNYSIIHNALNKNIKQSVSQLSLMESSLIKGQNSTKLLNEKYIKRTSMIFKDIYKKLNGKKYEGLKFTGQILPFILKHASKNLNSSKTIKMDKMFNEIKKDIYEKKIEAGKFIYNINYDILKHSQNNEQIKQTKKSSLKSSKELKTQKQGKDIAYSQTKKLNVNQINQMNNSLAADVQGDTGSSIKKAEVQKPRPLPLDEILQTFRKTNQNVIQNYNESKYDTNLHEQYEKKLIEYGQKKQKEVLEYNKKETYKVLSEKLPLFKSKVKDDERKNEEQKKKKDVKDSKLNDHNEIDHHLDKTHNSLDEKNIAKIKDSNPNDPNSNIQLDSQAILTYLHSLKISGLPLDHDRAKPVSQKLKDVCSQAQKCKYFNVWMTEEYYKQRKLQMLVNDKKKEIHNQKSNKSAVLLLNSHNDTKAEQLLDEHNTSKDKIERLKSQVDIGRKRNTNNIGDDEYINELKKHIKKLEDELKNNEKRSKELSLTPSKDSRINVLKQKLDDKKVMGLQVEAGLSNLANSRLNNSSSILTSRKSQIRKIGDGGIKKSTMNKSMTK